MLVICKQIKYRIHKGNFRFVVHRGVFVFGALILALPLMYLKASFRHNPDIRHIAAYYRLVESYRNESDRVCHKTLLNIGFWGDATKE